MGRITLLLAAVVFAVSLAACAPMTGKGKCPACGCDLDSSATAIESN